LHRTPAGEFSPQHGHMVGLASMIIVSVSNSKDRSDRNCLCNQLRRSAGAKVFEGLLQRMRPRKLHSHSTSSSRTPFTAKPGLAINATGSARNAFKAWRLFMKAWMRQSVFFWRVEPQWKFLGLTGRFRTDSWAGQHLGGTQSSAWRRLSTVGRTRPGQSRQPLWDHLQRRRRRL